MILRRVRWEAAVALACCLAGCVIPVPIEPRELASSRSNIGELAPAFIVVGRTTRADVLLGLGEPDQVSEHEQLFTYVRIRSEGGVMLLGGAGSSGGAIRSESMVYRFLSITFDEQAVVASVQTEQARCRQARSGMDPGVPDMGACAYPPGQARLLARFGRVFAPVQWVHGPAGSEWRRALGLEPPAPLGALVVGKAGIELFARNADAGSRPLASTAYADLKALSLRTTAAGQRLVLSLPDGGEESFSVLRGEGIDADRTAGAFDLARARWKEAAAGVMNAPGSAP